MKNKIELLQKWRSLKFEELKLELNDLVKEQFKLKMRKNIGELKETHKIRVIRKDIARVLSILKEKESRV